MQYKLAIFDLDGTILDTLEDLHAATNAALRGHAMPERTIDEVRRFVGNGIRKLIERAVPAGTSEEEIVRVHESFTAYYTEHCADHTRPYDGIVELLRNVREAGMLTAVVSNQADYAVQALVADYFPGLCDAAAGEREGVRRKPAPDAVDAVLAALNISREDAVYIGDSDVDIETARNASMPCLSVAWGFRPVDFLEKHGAQQIVKTPYELLDILLK